MKIKEIDLIREPELGEGPAGLILANALVYSRLLFSLDIAISGR